MESQLQISQPNNTCISVTNNNNRRETISFILQLSHNFDPMLSYLAIDYLHRFISTQPILTLDGKPWMLRLVAVSCVSLALKMRKTEFSLDCIQHEGGLMFDKKSVRRMELLILGGLNWQMRTLTPFSFLSFFLSFFQLKDPPLTEALQARATQIIFDSQHETKILEFRPSIVAASALLSASHELFPLQFSSYRDSISTCAYVNKADLSKCNDVMEEMATESYESMLDIVSSSNTNTAVNVLDRDWSSSSSDCSTALVSNTTMDTEAGGDFKRQKISFGSDETFQLSHIQQYF
ncbi:Cyclin-D6-1 like [Heracleum sosnowskyi]|uniref:Cyclin-D6-1 like n=1 Tax=Heracleum sosnowskyi TaxID=360622 RepID=A0AAD8JJ44_9APIA|nr:Cyclin-D6-1 like [Heracleum sosnowskyi]